ncbi:TonB-dependent receptor [Apibacter raozihei]|uniref:TonB-dependent receptor n=1 Tax=Apibacter raozihei TaxID=2500547 RepID=UPI000FE3BFE6|nr:TonB-dependent receptor [Apibacter raozihei]
MKKLYLICSLICCGQFLMAQNTSSIKGNVSNIENLPVADAVILVDGQSVSETTKSDGSFEIKGLSPGKHKITIISPDSGQYTESFSLDSNETKELRMTVYQKGDLDKILIYGQGKQPKGLDMITRIPLSPRELPQNISVISDEIINEQGALTLTDAVRNVPGVTLFGTYGGTTESMSIRGYRGTPVLKNGIQVDSDFRTSGILTDMQGVSSIQVLRGSASITQGIGNGLGSPGGVINVVTKTPLFLKDAGQVALESGSWGLFRSTLDYQTVLDKKNTSAFRLNAAFQRADSYKPRVDNNRVYVNPSFEWRPDDKTTVTLEMDYMNDNTTPDRGTTNLSEINTYNLLDTSKNFFGWGTDNVNTKTTTYSAKIVRKLNDKLSLRAVYAGSVNNDETYGVGSMANPYRYKDVVTGKTISDYTKRIRTLSWSESEDKNKVIQIDLIGKNLFTGKIKHTFQAGFDYKSNEKTSISHGSITVDTVNILEKIGNNLPSGISKKSFGTTAVNTKTYSEVYGFTVHDAIEFNPYIRANFALRYSVDGRKSNVGAANDAWDPFVGIMITPVKNISLFGNFATTTNLRSASNPTQDGGTIGASVTNQWEVGVKSDWFNKKLDFNVTYYFINNNDIAYQVYDNGVATGYYKKAGDLRRNGIEIEANGRILENLRVILGYSYSDVQYRKSIAYVNGSRPMNAPYSTANGWVQYLFNQGALKNLSLGVGVYYVGNRPVNDYSSDLRTDGHGTTPGVKPFNMPGYTTINAQLGYTYKDVGLKVFFNNIFDELGYTSYYRGGYINQIDPRNFKIQLSYNF